MENNLKMIVKSKELDEVEWRCDKDDRLLAKVAYEGNKTVVSIKCRGCKHIEERSFGKPEENQQEKT